MSGVVYIFKASLFHVCMVQPHNNHYIFKIIFIVK